MFLLQPKISHRFRVKFDVKGFNVSANCNILTNNLLSVGILLHVGAPSHKGLIKPSTILTFTDDAQNRVYDAIEVVKRGVEYAGKDSLSIVIENLGTDFGKEVITGSITLVNPSFEQLAHDGYDYATNVACKLLLNVSYDSLSVK
jgi:hypothetical protein